MCHGHGRWRATWDDCCGAPDWRAATSPPSRLSLTLKLAHGPLGTYDRHLLALLWPTRRKRSGITELPKTRKGGPAAPGRAGGVRQCVSRQAPTAKTTRSATVVLVTMRKRGAYQCPHKRPTSHEESDLASGTHSARYPVLGTAPMLVDRVHDQPGRGTDDGTDDRMAAARAAVRDGYLHHLERAIDTRRRQRRHHAPMHCAHWTRAQRRSGGLRTCFGGDACPPAIGRSERLSVGD